MVKLTRILLQFLYVFSITCFVIFPCHHWKEIKQKSLIPFENELIIQFRNIWDDTLRKLVIDQVRVVGEFDLQELVANKGEEIAFMMQEEKELLE